MFIAGDGELYPATWFRLQFMVHELKKEITTEQKLIETIKT